MSTLIILVSPEGGVRGPNGRARGAHYRTWRIGEGLLGASNRPVGRVHGTTAGSAGAKKQCGAAEQGGNEDLHEGGRLGAEAAGSIRHLVCTTVELEDLARGVGQVLVKVE